MAHERAWLERQASFAADASAFLGDGAFHKRHHEKQRRRHHGGWIQGIKILAEPQGVELIAALVTLTCPDFSRHNWLVPAHP
jgi:hypothetical protein